MMHPKRLTNNSKTIAVFTTLLISLGTIFFSGMASAQGNSPENQFQEVADTLAIQKLLGQYMNYVDAREFEDYANLFSEDGELIFQSFHITGREDIFNLMSNNGENTASTNSSPPTLVHTMSNSLIDLDGNAATHIARWINMSPNEDGQPVMRATGLYQDVLRKINGEWKIQRRVVTNEIPYVETTFKTD